MTLIKKYSLAQKIIFSTIFFLYSQKHSRKKIKSYQKQKLKKLLMHAEKNVPYYKNLFKKIGFKSKNFSRLEDIQKIPVLTKETLRIRSREFISDDFIKYGINWETTSGTTGTPLKILIDDSTKANYYGALLRSYIWAGYFFGKKTFSMKSYFSNSCNVKMIRIQNNYRMDSIQLNLKSAKEAAKFLLRVKPKFYHGYPFSFLMLAQIAEKENIRIHSPDSLIVYGETLSDLKREMLEKFYGCKVYDFYSLHECNAMVCECGKQNKHLIDDFAFHEVVKIDQSKDTGKLIGTNLYNYAMPLIRYETGDTVQLYENWKKCSCGLNYPIIKRIIGRQNDYIKTKDGRYIGNVLEHAIDKSVGVVMSQIVQDKIDMLTVRVVADQSFNKNSIFSIKEELKKRVGNDMKIEIKKVDQLEKTKGGKIKFMISKIGLKYI